MTVVDRRTVLAGTAGLLVLSACGGGRHGEPKGTDGPVIVDREAGNVVKPEDIRALANRLAEATDAHDLAALMALLEVPNEEFEKRWRRRLENFPRMKVISGSWLVGPPETRARNASGGALEYDSSIVFGHRIDGCDGRPVVESYPATLRKKSADAPLELVSVGSMEGQYQPAIWDYATTDAITTEHAVIAFRPQDRARAEASRKTIDAGFAQALSIIPPAKGVSRIFTALTWPEAQDVLWGGTGIKEAAGNAWPYAYLKPEEVAKGQKVRIGGAGAHGTARTGLHRGAFSSTEELGLVARHEAVHALACQWGDRAPVWGVEGLARWAESPGRVAATHPRARSVFPAFAARSVRPHFDFYPKGDQQQLEDNYDAAALVYDYIQDTKGRRGVLELAERLYATGGVDGEEGDVEATKRLFRKVEAWL